MKIEKVKNNFLLQLSEKFHIVVKNYHIAIYCIVAELGVIRDVCKFFADLN